MRVTVHYDRLVTQLGVNSVHIAPALLRFVPGLTGNTQSYMSSETSRPAPSALAAAAEGRVRGATPQKSTAQIASEYEKRQKFRRMIDPGITRPNAEGQAHRSLKVN
jgi:hypothetical protein